MAFGRKPDSSASSKPCDPAAQRAAALMFKKSAETEREEAEEIRKPQQSISSKTSLSVSPPPKPSLKISLPSQESTRPSANYLSRSHSGSSSSNAIAIAAASSAALNSTVSEYPPSLTRPVTPKPKFMRSNNNSATSLGSSHVISPTISLASYGSGYFADHSKLDPISAIYNLPGYKKSYSNSDLLRDGRVRTPPKEKQDDFEYNRALKNSVGSYSSRETPLELIPEVGGSERSRDRSGNRAEKSAETPGEGIERGGEKCKESESRNESRYEPREDPPDEGELHIKNLRNELRNNESRANELRHKSQIDERLLDHDHINFRKPPPNDSTSSYECSFSDLESTRSLPLKSEVPSVLPRSQSFQPTRKPPPSDFVQTPDEEEAFPQYPDEYPRSAHPPRLRRLQSHGLKEKGKAVLEKFKEKPPTAVLAYSNGAANGFSGPPTVIEKPQQPVTMKTTMRKDKSKKFNEDKPWKNHSATNLITDDVRKRYEGVFVANRGLYMDKCLTETSENKMSFINALVVRELWSRSRLPSSILEKIWDLVDSRKTGCLDRRQFLVGMWLVDQCLYGRKLPKLVSDQLWASVQSIGVNVVIKGKHRKKKA